MIEKPRSLVLFYESIKSEKTRVNYDRCLTYFLKFVSGSTKEIKDITQLERNTWIESLLKTTPEQIQTLLEDYTLSLKKTITYGALNMYLASIDKFLTVNDIEYKKNKIRMLMPQRRKPAGEKAYTTKQIQKMLDFTDSTRVKALIHVLSASGIRAGAIEELKFKHMFEMDENCYGLKIYAGSDHEYITFLHWEARKALDDYANERRANGELINGDSFVFSTLRKALATKSRPLTTATIGTLLSNVLDKTGIKRERGDTSKHFEISISKGFRKRYNTILKSNAKISFAIAERMMDHRTYLEHVYLDTSDSNKFFEEYKKAIPELLISDEERNKIKLQKFEAELTEHEKTKLEVKELKEFKEKFAELLEDMQSHPEKYLNEIKNRQGAELEQRLKNRENQ